MQVPFGEWLPDQPEHLKQGANVATNVYHTINSYKRFPSLVSYSSNTMNQDSRGAGSFRDNTNTVFNFTANNKTIFKLENGAFTEIGAQNKLTTSSFASFTITVTDSANISPGATITFKDNAGNSTTMTATATNPTSNANEFSIASDNASTADNIAVGAGGVLGINCLSGFSAPNPSGNVVTVTRAVAGGDNLTVTSSDPTRLAVTNFTGGTPLSGTDTDYITFTQFGNYVIASNGVDPAQYYEMGTSTKFKNLSTIATAGTTPVFRVSGVVRDFLVTGNQPNNKNRIQWSGINDLATWSGKQADFQDLSGSGGQIVAITSGEIGYVFRQNQIIRMDYVGGTVVFRLSVISPNRGAVYGRTVCQDNRNVFFYSDDGFYQLAGDSITPIGAEKINRFFDLNLNKAYTDRICAAVDPFNQLAIWLYPSVNNTSNTTGICDRILIYNYATKKWSLGITNASTIFSQFVGAYTVELMDIISQNLENINAALDTDFWSGGQLFLGAIDNNFKAAIFSGNNNECEIETSELEPFPGQRANITGVRPIVDAVSTLTVKTKERTADTETASSSVTQNASGMNPVRKSGRYIRANVKVASGTTFTHAQGVDFVATKAGNR